MSRVLVTGATGRIGIPLVRLLSGQRAGGKAPEVIGLARDEAGAHRVREAGGTPHIGDCLQPGTLVPALTGVDVVYHLAGGKRGPGTTTPDVLNRQATEGLLKAISEVKGRPPRLVFASTSAVYGDRSSLWVEEDFVPSPNTRYGQSKVAAEALCHQAHQAGTIDLVIARIGAVYGPQFPFCMADQIKSGQAWLPGEGRNCIPVIHIDDCTRALLHLAERGQSGEIYHVADQTTPSPNLEDFYAEVHKRVGGSPMRFWSTWIPSYVQRFIAQNNERIQSKLNNTPKLTPDNLKLFTSSVRLKTDKLAKGLGFTWLYPEFTAGLEATFRGATS